MRNFSLLLRGRVGCEGDYLALWQAGCHLNFCLSAFFRMCRASANYATGRNALRFVRRTCGSFPNAPALCAIVLPQPAAARSSESILLWGAVGVRRYVERLIHASWVAQLHPGKPGCDCNAFCPCRQAVPGRLYAPVASRAGAVLGHSRDGWVCVPCGLSDWDCSALPCRFPRLGYALELSAASFFCDRPPFLSGSFIRFSRRNGISLPFDARAYPRSVFSDLKLPPHEKRGR